MEQHGQAKDKRFADGQRARFRDQEIGTTHEEMYLVRIAPDKHLMMGGIGEILYLLQQAFIAPRYDQECQAAGDGFQDLKILFDAAKPQAAAHQQDGRLSLRNGQCPAYPLLVLHVFQDAGHGDAHSNQPV